MAKFHGVTTSEVQTGLIPMVNSDAGLPVVIGTAPIFMTKNAVEAYNNPILAYSFDEAVQALGFVDAGKDGYFEYTLCEFMDSHFRLFENKPVVFINVFDITKSSPKTESLNLVSGKVELGSNKAILSTIVVTKESEKMAYGEDYLVTYNKQGNAAITALSGGKLGKNDAISVAFDEVDYTFKIEDIIGGVDAVTGDKKGLELISDVFPSFRLVPGQIVVPKYSGQTVVSALVSAKSNNINGLFKAIAPCDLGLDENNYTKIPALKNEGNFVDPNQVACWPMVSLGGKKYHLSTQFAGLVCATDAENGNIPYKSPSNENLKMDSAVIEGKFIKLDPQNANYLNQQGIYTALNFIGGWKGWGNRTATYPGNTDPKDAFIAVRRMFNWISNTLILTYWQKVDNPMNKQQIDSVVDSINLWMNGLTAQGQLLGGRVEFLQGDNPTLDLLDGMVRFRLKIGGVIPMEQIEFILEFDPSYLSNLF